MLISSDLPNKIAVDADQNHASSQVNNRPPDTSEPQVAGADPNLEPRTLTDIVMLAEKHDEILLASLIRNHVRPVTLQPGRLEITLTGNTPKTLLGDLAKQLFNWTGKRWLVSLSEEKGAKTIAEETSEADARLQDKIAKDPLVTKILEVFPGATIDTITPTSSPEKPLEIDNDTSYVDNEEMSL